jgi:ADP-heptose:LPS heptosyltransferase
MKILYGFFSGLGDIVITTAFFKSLSKKHDVTYAYKSTFNELVEIIGLDDNKRLEFNEKSINFFFQNLFYIYQIIRNKYDYILISPHASHNHSSTFLFPFLISLFKSRHTKIVGNFYDSHSKFFDIKIKSDLNLNIYNREKEFLFKAGLLDDAQIIYKNVFGLKKIKPKKKIIFHPFAGLVHRVLSPSQLNVIFDYFANNADYDFFVIGTESEIFKLRKKLSLISKNVLFKTDNLSNILHLIKDCKLIITMDSGFSHVAAALQLNHLMISGATDSVYISPESPKSVVFEKVSIYCQPCNSNNCNQESNFCLTNISPYEIIERIKLQLK